MAAKKRANAPSGAQAVDAYLAALPEAQRRALEKLRAQVRAAAPGATERMGYGMPGFYLDGPLVYMAAFKEHCSLFGGTGTLTDELADALRAFETSKGTIRFTPAKPLPAALVRRIVKLRVEQNAERAAARRKELRARGRGSPGEGALTWRQG